MVLPLISSLKPSDGTIGLCIIIPVSDFWFCLNDKHDISRLMLQIPRNMIWEGDLFVNLIKYISTNTNTSNLFYPVVVKIMDVKIMLMKPMWGT